jgi:hypothetical protein
MADFNYHLKNNKILVFFTIFAFLYMSCFTSCSKSSNQEKTETAKKSNRVEKTEKSEAPKTETASNQETAESDNSTQSDKSDDPCAGCPPSETQAARSSKPFTQKDWDRLASDLDQYFLALEETSKEIPRDTFEPQVIVDRLEQDPKAIFQWVRDNTRLLPYQGVLRGPVGVLMDRWGSSLDRALLLHELLRLAGVEVRLAQGRLSEKVARDIVEKSQARRDDQDAGLSQFSPQEADKFTNEFSARYKTDPEFLKRTIDRVVKEREQFSRDLTGRVTEQLEFISAAVQKYAKKGRIEKADARIEALRDHWWVQIQDGGAWTDLDPATTDMAPGSAFCPAENVLQPDDIDRSLVHSVNLRIIVEQWKNGTVEEKTVLEHELYPAELLGQRVVIRHVPMNWPKDWGLAGEKDPVRRLKTLVLEEKEWQPVLAVGSEVVAQSSFTSAGDVNKNPGKKGRPSGVQGITGGILGALGGKEEEEKPEESFLTAEWFEYTIHVPGVPDQTIRRQGFDLIGPALRKKPEIPAPPISDSIRLERGLTLLGESEVFLQAHRLSPEYASYLLASRLLPNRQALKEILTPVNTAKNLGETFGKLQNLTPLPGAAFILASARLSWTELGKDVAISQPNIICFVERPLLDLSGKIRIRSGFDIVSNEISLGPNSGSNALRAKIYQGVLDSNAETLLLKGIGGSLDSAAEAFMESRKQQIGWVTLDDSSGTGLQQLGTSEDNRARIEQDLRAGCIVLAPEKEVQVGDRQVFCWWRFDPNRGSLLGLGPEGGQTYTEYILTAIHTASISMCVIRATLSSSILTAFCHAITCLVGGVSGSLMHFALKMAMSETFAILGFLSGSMDVMSELCFHVDRENWAEKGEKISP